MELPGRISVSFDDCNFGVTKSRQARCISLQILPVVLVISSLMSELVAFTILFVAATITLHTVNPTILFLPLIVVSQILFTGGLSCLLASLGVYIRDIRHLMALALSAWMYATPIVYPASALPEKLPILGLDQSNGWNSHRLSTRFVGRTCA